MYPRIRDALDRRQHGVAKRRDDVLIRREVLGDDRHRLLDVAILLELDVESDPTRGQLQHLLQRRSLSALDSRLQLMVFQARDRTSPDVGVVHHHEPPVGGAADVQFDRIAPECHGGVERRQRVLWR